MIKAFLRKIAYAALVVGVVLLICALVYGLVWLLNSLSSLITAFATIAIALYTWALRDSTNRSSSRTPSIKAFGGSSNMTIQPV